MLAAGAWWAQGGLAAAAPRMSSRSQGRAFPWSWSVNLNVRAMTENSFGYLPYLDLASLLGAGLVRFDIFWSDLEPERGLWLEDRLAWRIGLVDAARRKGLDLIVNLSGYPRWALDELAGDREGFYAAWRSYVGRVAAAARNQVAYYQLDNEFNTILDPLPRNQDVRVFHEGARALQEARARYPTGRARIVINPFYGFSHIGSDWAGALATVVPAATDAIDVIALDDYPGSYDFWNDPRWSRPLEELGYYARRYDKLLAVGETGCPTYLLGDARQAHWYGTALTSLAASVKGLGLTDRFTYVNLFELVDRPPLELWEFWRPTEVTLGLAHRNLVPKAAFYEIQRLIASGATARSPGRRLPSQRLSYSP